MTDVDNKECPVSRMGIILVLLLVVKMYFALNVLLLNSLIIKLSVQSVIFYIDLNKVNIIIKDQDKKEEVKDENLYYED